METVQPEPSPVVSYEQPIQPQPVPEQPGGRSFHVSKKIVLLGAIILVLLMVTGGVLLKNRKSTTPKTAQTQDILLATVGDQKIYKSDVGRAAAEQYQPSAITEDVLKKFYTIIVERALLDREAKNLHVTVSDIEIMSSISSTSAQTPLLTDTVKYQLIKTKIIQKQVKSVDAFTIGYWIPPMDYPQVPLFAQQRLVGKQALEEGKLLIKSGQKPLQVAKFLYSKYSLVQSIIAINGTFVKNLTDDTIGVKPRTYTVGHSDFDESLFSLKAKDVTIIDGKNGSGATLIDVETVNSGDFKDYESWLDHQKKTVVKTINTL